MAQFSELFTNFMFIGLLVLSVFAFGSLFQTENSVTDKFTNNTLIANTYTDLESDLGNLRGESDKQKDLFEEENPTTGFGTILLFSIVSSGKVFGSMTVGLFNTIVKLPVVFLGVDQVIVSVISTLLIFSIIIGLWIIYKLGS